MCLKNENTKKQNEMELEPDLCEKFDPVPILNQSWNQTLSSVPGFLLIITPRGRFPPNSNNQIITIQFQVYLDPEPGSSSDSVLGTRSESGLGNHVHQGTQPTLLWTHSSSVWIPMPQFQTYDMLANMISLPVAFRNATETMYTDYFNCTLESFLLADQS